MRFNHILCMSPQKAARLIKGIGNDNDTAWEYFDSIDGDSQFILDTIMQDIINFHALQGREDARFCDLAHLLGSVIILLKKWAFPAIWMTAM